MSEPFGTPAAGELHFPHLPPCLLNLVVRLQIIVGTGVASSVKASAYIDNAVNNPLDEVLQARYNTPSRGLFEFETFSGLPGRIHSFVFNLVHSTSLCARHVLNVAQRLKEQELEECTRSFTCLPF
jgi:hypothetical protein